MSKPADLLQGTLDFPILRTRERQPSHRVGVAGRIEQVIREDVRGEKEYRVITNGQFKT